MLAVHLENGAVSVREIPVPERPPGFALLRLLIAASVTRIWNCSADITVSRAFPATNSWPKWPPPIRLRWWAGGWWAKSTWPATPANGARAGLARHCPHRTVLGIVNQPGAFQEYFVLPERNLHIVPDGIDTRRAVFTEPLAAACEILDQVDIPAGETVAVLGDGKLGLLIAMVLRAHGCRVRQIGRHVEKLRIAKALGVEVELEGNRAPAAQYSWVVDATGSAEGLRTAAAMVRPRGTVILKSTVHGMVAGGHRAIR